MLGRCSNSTNCGSVTKLMCERAPEGWHQQRPRTGQAGQTAQRSGCHEAGRRTYPKGQHCEAGRSNIVDHLRRLKDVCCLALQCHGHKLVLVARGVVLGRRVEPHRAHLLLDVFDRLAVGADQLPHSVLLDVELELDRDAFGIAHRGDAPRPRPGPPPAPDCAARRARALRSASGL